MAYRLGNDVAILFVAWVIAFGYLTYFSIIRNMVLVAIISFIGLIVGGLVLLHKPDEAFGENDRKKTPLKA